MQQGNPPVRCCRVTYLVQQGNPPVRCSRVTHLWCSRVTHVCASPGPSRCCRVTRLWCCSTGNPLWGRLRATSEALKAAWGAPGDDSLQGSLACFIGKRRGARKHLSENSSPGGGGGRKNLCREIIYREKTRGGRGRRRREAFDSTRVVSVRPVEWSWWEGSWAPPRRALGGDPTRARPTPLESARETT